MFGIICFQIKVGHHDRFCLQWGLVMEIWHTHTLNTHTVIHRWLLIHPPKTNILLIEEILHEFYTCLVVEDLFHQQQNLSLVQMIFLFQGCIMYSQGSCAVNLPGRIRWPEGMNPQARYVPPW